MRLVSWNIMAGGGGRYGASAPRSRADRGMCVLARRPIRRRRADPPLFRIDHAFASAELAPRARGCWYDHTVRERGLSDHSALVVELAELAV